MKLKDITSICYDLKIFFENNFSQDPFIKNHIYYENCIRMLSWDVNNYINFLNFNLILNTLKDYKWKKFTCLDLWCWMGDKSVIMKQLFPKADIIWLETVEYDDPDHQKNKPYEFFEKIYSKINERYNINCSLYNGKNLDNLSDNSLDVLLLYAVIEHIAPEHRKKIIDIVSCKIKKSWYIIITRCPRYYGLMEFISRKFNLWAHEWVLKKKELLSYFDTEVYSVEKIKILNNIPNNYWLTQKAPKFFILVDKILSFIHWPFATDYFLVLKKR